MTDSEDTMIKATLENMLQAHQTLDANMRIAIGIIGELRQRVEKLERVMRTRSTLVDREGKELH